MCNVNMYEAKTNLSKYVDMIESGEQKEIFLCRRGKKIAKIVPVSEELTKKRLGAAIGILPNLPVGFDDPKLDEEIANDFNL